MPHTPDRIKALITDLFMIYMPILYIITYIFMDGADDFKSSQLAPFIGVLIYGLIYSVLLAKFGQTPGKKAYDIQVVDSKSHQKIVIFRAFWRFLCFIFSATTLLGLLLPLFRKDKKSLHDILSGYDSKGFKELR
ncbi:MAG: RDD family protein [Sulfurimonas sp.]|nr:RDD family protein [Sulfurimonas sp.]